MGTNDLVGCCGSDPNCPCIAIRLVTRVRGRLSWRPRHLAVAGVISLPVFATARSSGAAPDHARVARYPPHPLCRFERGVVGVTFLDLRATAVTRLAIAGCTEAEIATITGHSLRSVRYSTRITLRVIRRLARAPSASSKREQNLPTDPAMFSVENRRCVEISNGWGTRIRT